MTIDEELDRLDDGIRRLKIEYETYFNGGNPRPPSDLLFRVEKTIKRFASGTSELSFRQRFRFNQLAQRYAVHNDLWRKKLKIKEEGPQHGTASSGSMSSKTGAFRPFCIDCAEPDQETIERLMKAVVQARTAAGQTTPVNPELFGRFIRDKTKQLKASLDCERIRYSVAVEGGEVKLRAEKLREKIIESS